MLILKKVAAWVYYWLRVGLSSEIMVELVILKFVQGNFEQGFFVNLYIWSGSDRPEADIEGYLPPAPELPIFYNKWRSAYLSYKEIRRIQKKPLVPEDNYSDAEVNETAKNLLDFFNNWLKSEQFIEIKERLLVNLAKLTDNDEMLLIIQTKDPLLRRLPWHCWNLLLPYSHQVEVALSAPKFQRVVNSSKPKEKIRILAIIGDITGINTKPDTEVINNLCGNSAEAKFLHQPSTEKIKKCLSDEQGWDIFFFAGHSSSQANGENGCIYVNQTTKITIPELEEALTTSINRGLQLAIFNSCDGLGIASDFAALQIPQMIVMREPVADAVAQFFLKYFLEAFYNGKSLYASVREARKVLEGYKTESPCASWLPVICQNPAHKPPTWDTLLGIDSGIVESLKFDKLPVKEPLKDILMDSNEISKRLVTEKELSEAFLQLNYQKQDSLFTDCSDAHNFGCFLLQGSPNYGQAFLLKRLIEYVPRSNYSQKIRIDLNRKNRKNDFNTIFNEIGVELGDKSSCSRQSVAAKISETLISKNIFIFIENINLWEEDLIEMLKFWRYVARLHGKNNYSYRLIMFFIDCKGCRNVSNDFIENFFPEWQPDVPVILRITDGEKFSETELTLWLKQMRRKLLPEAINLIRRDIEFILSQTDLPELVMQEICKLCKCDWSLIEKCLKI